ncbi:MAG: RelA/SpoT family protein [Candidatus Paceibacterota bacterium]|jgi:RelA/SpoT family (p)ppGpp synthetase
MDPKEIIGLMRDPSGEDKTLIERAFAFAERAHAGQKRKSGEPYIIHPFNTALILAEFHADAETIAAGLLHDTAEDTEISLADLEKEFGKQIAFMVEGVTKLGQLRYHGVKRHTESLRKLFVAMSEDIRIIVIRLADRLHNVRTLKYLLPEKQKRIALETLEIYAPLAGRLGIWRLKGMLEDASFPFAYPEEYKKVVTLRKTKGKETVKRLEKVYRTLQKELSARGLKDFDIDYRIKYLYSLYAKLLRKNMDIDEIYDISALRVIVKTVDECYQVLGVIHNLWRPIPGRLKDYIANPKPNGYQSIHTSIFTGDGNAVEIQIRTVQMQHEAEFGVASHVIYDETGKLKTGKKLTKDMGWIEELIEWQKHIKEDEKFITHLKDRLSHERIFVFTPKGEVVELPKDSSPLDFAYAIHSDIGHHAAGAKINNKMAPLDSNLKNGDVVSIMAHKNSHPTAKWLNMTKTTNAKRHVRNFLLEKKEFKAKNS